MKKSIFDTKWLIILFIPLFEPIIFAKNNFLHFFYAAILLVSFIFVIFMYYKKSEKIPAIIIPIIIYRIMLLISTILNHGDYIKWGYLSVVMIMLILLLNLSLKKNPKNTFDCILTLFTFLLIINCLLEIKYPKGLLGYDDLHFLGIRTRITDYAFPTLVIAFYQFAVLSKKYYLIPIIISIISIIQNSVSTAYIGVMILFVAYFFYKHKVTKKHRFSKKIGMKLFLFSLIITYLIVFVRIGDLLNPLFINLFGKSSTFSGRTYIWDLALTVIKKHPIIGMGILNDGNFVPIYINNGYTNILMLRQAHNQLLQSLYDGGLISTGLLYYIIYISFKKCSRYYKDYNIQIFNFALFSLLIMMIAEIYFYYPAPYMLLFICYYTNYLKKKEIGDLNEK